MRTRHLKIGGLWVAALGTVLAVADGCAEPAADIADQDGSVEACRLPDADAGWLSRALSDWRTVMTDVFHQPMETPPLMVLLGLECVWATGTGAARYLENADAGGVLEVHGDALPVLGATHAGEIVLPSGETAPAAPLAHTAPAEGGDVFFVIAASEIWRSVFPEEQVEAIPQFLVGVAIHELTHTRQGGLLDRLGAHVENHPELGDIDDDFIEQTYGETPGFADAVGRERAELIGAIREPDRESAAAATREILAAYRNRQQRFYGDSLNSHRFLEDAFLTMEGIAGWSAFQALEAGENATGGAPERIAAYYDDREDGNLVQTHGALFTALLDRLDPDWRASAFEADAPLLPERLERAAAQ